MARLAPDLPKWVRVGAVIVTAAGAVIAERAGIVNVPTAVVGVVAMAAFAAAWGDANRIAFGWGALLTIEQIDQVKPRLLDGGRYALVALLCLLVPASLSVERRKRLAPVVALIALLAVVRAGFARYHHDSEDTTTAMVMFAGVVGATLVAMRPRLHRAILFGYLAGLTLNAVVATLQFVGLPAGAKGNPDGRRYPGWAGSTTLLTWYLATGVIIGLSLATDGRNSRNVRVAGAVGVAAALSGMLVCGSQGGLLGLFVAAVVVALRAVPKSSGRMLMRLGLPALVIGLLGILALSQIGVDLPTVDGIMGAGGYHNEKTRVDLNRAGWHTLLDHPAKGVGTYAFRRQNRLAPHFLPLDSGTAAGAAGFLIALAMVAWVAYLLVKAPRHTSRYALTGLVLAAAMFSDTFVEPNGPYVGLSRLPILLIALVAALGEPVEPWVRTEPEDPPRSTLRAPEQSSPEPSPI